MNNKPIYKALKNFLTEYTDKNINNEYRPVAVGKYGIRKRESIYSKELASDYSKNKVIYRNTLTIGMGSNQIDIGILTNDEKYSVSPAYHTYRINGINAKYLDYCLKCRNKEMFEMYSKRGARQGKSIDLEKWLTFKIPIYDSDVQEKIVQELELISNIIEFKNITISLYEELLDSKFNEIFGDPVLNEKNWTTKPLVKIGDFKNGMNFKNGDSGVKINCLGVGDFKNLSAIRNTYELPTISLKEMPSEQYLLKNGDIVFVRSNGNKELVGRSISIYPKDIPTTFSGFCIRFRRYDNCVNIPYLLRVLKHDSIRKKIKGKGADIQNLNQEILKSLIIPIPPIELQEEFANFILELENLKNQSQKRCNLYFELLAKTMDKYFY